jgi:hypothetical protein
MGSKAKGQRVIEDDTQCSGMFRPQGQRPASIETMIQTQTISDASLPQSNEFIEWWPDHPS